MTHTLHVYALKVEEGSGDYLLLVRAIRAARVITGDPGTMADAARVIDVAMERGHAVIAEAEERSVILRAMDAARMEMGDKTSVARFILDRSDEWFGARARAEEGMTPEESIAAAQEAAPVEALLGDDSEEAWPMEVTETALVLLAQCHGNAPACLVLSNRLREVTGDPDLYAAVSGCLLRAFRATASGSDG